MHDKDTVNGVQLGQIAGSIWTWYEKLITIFALRLLVTIFQYYVYQFSVCELAYHRRQYPHADMCDVCRQDRMDDKIINFA